MASEEAFNPIYYDSGVFQVKDENYHQTDESGEPLSVGWYYWFRKGRTKDSDIETVGGFKSRGAAMSALNKKIDAERGRWEAQGRGEEAQGRSTNPALEVRGDDDEEEFEPDDDDAYLIDVIRGGTEVVVEQKSLGVFKSQDKAEQKLVEWITKNKVYPSVWWVSDHGNTHPYKLDTKYQEEIDEAMRNTNPALEVRMRGTDIVGYTYDADTHSIKATKQAWKSGRLKEVKKGGRLDQHGIPEDLEDSEGNMVHPVFASDEGWEESDFDDRSANPALEARAFGLPPHPLDFKPIDGDAYLIDVSETSVTGKGNWAATVGEKSLGIFKSRDKAEQKLVEWMVKNKVKPTVWVMTPRSDFPQMHTLDAKDQKEIDEAMRNTNPALEVRWAKAGAMDEVAARELFLFIENYEGKLANQHKSIITNLAKKYAKGVYNKDLAIKLWTYLADNGAKIYTAQYGDTVFTPATRRETARMLEESNFPSVQDESLNYGTPKGGQRSTNPALEVRGYMKGVQVICAWLPVNQAWVWFYGDPNGNQSDWSRISEMGVQRTREEALDEAKYKGLGKHKKKGKAIMVFEVDDYNGQNSTNPALEVRGNDGATRSLFGKLNQQVWYKGANK